MRRLLVLLPLMILTLAGCESSSRLAGTAAPAPLDETPVEVSELLARPATATATGSDFEALWRACEETSRGLLMPIDRSDRRGGILTTEPTVSAQFFEPWRRDVRTPADATASSLATIRRTVRFEFARRADGGFEVTPKVIVERQSLAERRTTAILPSRTYFRPVRDTEVAPFGTRETDRGVSLPRNYYYPVGRDEQLERAIAASVQKRIGS